MSSINHYTHNMCWK